VAFYQWECAFTANLTYRPPADLQAHDLIFQGARNSHLHLDSLPEIDCFATIYLLDRDHFKIDESGPVKIDLAVPADEGPWMESALQVGAGFAMFVLGKQIATGIITEVLAPLTPITT
jgi:hypothetical protein